MSDRPQSQQSLPPLDSPYLVNSSSRSPYGKGTPSSFERHQMIKLQEQIKSFQDEISVKDKIIEEMSSLEVNICPEHLADSTRSNMSRNQYLDKEEVASLKVKIDNLKSELVDLSRDITAKDNLIETLRRANGELKEELARLQVTLENSAEELEETRQAKNAYQTFKERNNILIKNLEVQLKESQEKFMESRINEQELHSRLTDCNEDKENVESQIAKLKETIAATGAGNYECIDDIVNDLKTLQYDKDTSNNKIESLEERLKSKDCEQQASRQTINRLVAKLSSEEAQHSECADDLKAVKSTLEEVSDARNMLQSEIQSINCIVMSLKKELELANNDNTIKDNRIKQLTEEVKNSSRSNINRNTVNEFIDTLVSILEDGFAKPSNLEDNVGWILGCVRSLIRQKYEASTFQESHDSLKSEALEMDKSGSAESHESPERMRLTIDDLRSRLDKEQRELASAQLQIEGLNCHKLKYLRILTELAKTMNIDEINQDIGFDMITDALYARAEQLMKLESETITNQRLSEYSLQRKVKELKERVHSKDLHIDLLHKKIGSLEERQFDKSNTTKERDKEVNTNKKLSKLNQNQQEEIEGLREEVINLKSKLIESNKNQAISLSLDKEVKQLTAKVAKLEKIKQNQAQLINTTKSGFKSKENEIQKEREEARTAIESLREELRMVKDSLDDSRKKEHQMLELRAVISRLLGLELDSLAIPDYEIVNRLERLVTAHQSNVFTAYSMESTLKDINRGFYQGQKLSK